MSGFVFTLAPFGNVGNRMLICMAAHAVAARLNEPVRINAALPEWGMSFDTALHFHIYNDPATCWLKDIDCTSLDEMVSRIIASGSCTVMFSGFFQRYNLFREVEFCRTLFPLQKLDIEPFAADELVINIRAGELLEGGVSWYPLVPPGFYRMLAERTGLRLVLLGQLDDSPYVQTIKQLCPGARLLPSAGPMVDFNRLRHARNLCITVSTFSWLAAWLSQAETIHYPLLGFLHPFCIGQGWENGGAVDLTPLGDERYAYHLFPILNALPQMDYLRHVLPLNPVSMPVSAGFAAGLSAQARNVPGALDNVGGAARWYIKRYPEAAWSLALGQYSTARAHYEQTGRRNGYAFSPLEPFAARRARPNLALEQPATQSSVSEWSRAATPEGDAAGAVDGVADDRYGFHTALEDAPWWRVDLGASCRISDIWLFNRLDQPNLAERASQLAIDIGETEAGYKEHFRLEAPTPFGGADGHPLTINFHPPAMGRYVRLRLLNRNFLHLSQVEVYGERA